MTGGTVYPHVVDVLSTYSQAVHTAVELGCGGKQYGVFASDAVYFGLDLKSDMYEGAGPDVISDAQHLPFRDASTDLIFIVAAFHLVQDLDAAISEAKRVLRPGGSFLVFDYSWLVCRRLGAPHRLSTRGLVARFRRHGLIPSVHRRYAPARGFGSLARLMSCRPIQALAYYLGRWIIVAGRRPA